MSNDAFVTNKEFDNLLAEARRFDGKSRRAQAEANGTLDVIAEAKKQMEAMTGNSSIQKVLGKNTKSERAAREWSTVVIVIVVFISWFFF